MYFYNKLVSEYVKCFSELCGRSSNLTEPEEGPWEPLTVAGGSEAQVATWTCDPRLERRVVSRDLTLSAVIMELKSGAPCGAGVLLD